nr:uncharacterized protein LOC103306540 [Chrysemys picta bellii]
MDLNYGTTLLKDNEAINSRWKERFDDLLNRNSMVVDEVLEQIPQRPFRDELGDPPSLYEVHDATMQMKNNKAAGLDGIPAEIFKNGGPELIHQLYLLILKIWIKEEIPGEMRDALMVTLFKKGDKVDCGNYHGSTAERNFSAHRLLVHGWVVGGQPSPSEPETTVANQDTGTSEAGGKLDIGSYNQKPGIQPVLDARKSRSRVEPSLFVQLPAHLLASVRRDSTNRGCQRLGAAGWRLAEQAGKTDLKLASRDLHFIITTTFQLSPGAGPADLNNLGWAVKVLGRRSTVRGLRCANASVPMTMVPAPSAAAPSPLDKGVPPMTSPCTRCYKHVPYYTPEVSFQPEALSQTSQCTVLSSHPGLTWGPVSRCHLPGVFVLHLCAGRSTQGLVLRSTQPR